MSQYTLQTGILQDCLRTIIEQPIHPTFAAYLGLQQQSELSGKSSTVRLQYIDYLDGYFELGDQNAESQYFIPFSDSSQKPVESRWVSKERAQSNRPEDLPQTSPLLKVASPITREQSTEWKLKEEHWKLARFELVKGNQVPVESLAAFLLRDYAFETETPSALTVVQAFTEEFGYQLGGKAFTHLFRTGDSNITEDTFERYD